jgi:hypothetical protein
VGWVIVVGHTKRQFQIANLLKVDFRLESSKNKHFTSCNVSKCPYGSQDIKRETNHFFFPMSFGIFVFFQKTIGISVSFQFHTHVNM